MLLMREVRCYPTGAIEAGDARNSWLGSPAGDAVEPFVVLRAVVDGPVDPVTGFVCRIERIESLLRDGAAALIANRCRSAGNAPPSAAILLREAFPLVAAIGSEDVTLRSLTLATSPRLSFTMNDRSPDVVGMTQCFEFSAAHRLHCSALSDDENRRLFGKCANPNEGVPGEADGRVEPLPSFQRAVKERVIDRFDHKHLNLDCPEFRSLNPTVEHIARVIWNLLEGAFDRARLTRVRVWETPKTFAEYSGPERGDA